MTKIHPGKLGTVILTLLLTAALLPADTATAENTAVFTDTASTPFYSAVSELASAGIITGYGDGTFRPYRSLTRAEACALMYRAYGDENLSPYSSYNFSDVPDSMWASRYINYCAGAGIVNGYGNRIFRPDAQVTYNEIICMTVRARNLNRGQTLSWPDGYISAARADGMLADLDGSPLANNGNNSANRGNTAMLIYSGSSYNTTAAAGPHADDLADPANDCVAYGIVTGTRSGTDTLGNSCTIARLLMGGRQYDVIPATDRPDLLNGLNPASGIVRLIIYDGRTASVQRVTSARSGNSSYGLLTPASGNQSLTQFCRLSSIYGRRISYAADSYGTVQMAKNAVCYRIFTNGNNLGARAIKASDMGAGDMICAYTVTGSTEADIVIDVGQEETGTILSSSGSNTMNLG